MLDSKLAYDITMWAVMSFFISAIWYIYVSDKDNLKKFLVLGFTVIAVLTGSFVRSSPSYTVFVTTVIILGTIVTLVPLLAINDYLFNKFRAWHKKRYWEKRHLEFLKVMLKDDARWLSVDAFAREITDRHEKFSSDDWYKLDHEGIQQFRNDLLRKYRSDPSKGIKGVLTESDFPSNTDLAVDNFALKMKAKLTKCTEEGKSGWDNTNWSPEDISKELRRQVELGDPVNVANFCLFLSMRKANII